MVQRLYNLVVLHIFKENSSKTNVFLPARSKEKGARAVFGTKCDDWFCVYVVTWFFTRCLSDVLFLIEFSSLRLSG